MDLSAEQIAQVKKDLADATNIATTLNVFGLQYDTAIIMSGISMYLAAISIEHERSKDELLQVLDKTLTIHFEQMTKRFERLKELMNAVPNSGSSKRYTN